MPKEKKKPININPTHKGEFTRKAKSHGKTPGEFASYVMGHRNDFDSGTVEQANFARNFGHKKKK